MRQKELKHHKGILAVLVVVCGALLFLSIQHVYTLLTAPEEQHVNMPAMTPYAPQASAPVPSLAPQHRTVTLATGRSLTTGSVSFAPQTTPNYNQLVYTTSSATVHSIGGGGSTGGNIAMSTSSTSARGIRYNTSSFSMPAIAMASTTSSAYQAMPRRRIQANGDGSYDGETKSEGGYTYYWDEAAENWILSMPVGATKTEGGITYIWNGSSWEVVTGTDPAAPTPVGNIPWWIIFILTSLYSIAKDVKKQKG